MNADTLRTRPNHIYLACTGAGTGLADLIWRIPGISEQFVGASIPYGHGDLARFLGFVPGNVSEATAIDMAMEAYMRAYQPHSGFSPVGLGLTASVASMDIHRGDHRIHAAVVTDDGVFVKTLILEKGIGREARIKDGEIADRLGLEMLLQPSGERRDEEAFTRFMQRPVFWGNGIRLKSLDDEPSVARAVDAIFPGAFNPPHHGHFGIIEHIPGQTIFSVTVDPPHKKALTLSNVLQKAKLLRGYNFMFTQGDPLYIEKARCFPGKAFVIGVDALLRMLDPKWGVEVPELLREFYELGTSFYVVGREVEGEWRTLEDVLTQIPSSYQNLFTEVGGRWDVSSTALRNAG